MLCGSTNTKAEDHGKWGASTLATCCMGKFPRGDIELCCMGKGHTKPFCTVSGFSTGTNPQFKTLVPTTKMVLNCNILTSNTIFRN